MSKITLIFYLLLAAIVFSFLYIIFDLEFFKWGFNLKFNTIETISSRWREVYDIVTIIFSFIKRFFAALFNFLAPLFKELVNPN
jgi:hypothetical protein